jgi:uncharacterized protein
MTTTAFLSVAAASLVGSVHCAAMCGGFVAAYAGGGESVGERAAAHAAYNGGRLVTYLALGAAAGFLGSALDLAGHAAGLADAAGIVTGVLLLVSGYVGLSARPKLVRLETKPRRGIAARLGTLLATFRAKPPVVRALVLGLSTTLLPCGWLYAFAAFAAGTGSPSSGAALMGAFWIGSLPVMLGVGVSLQALTRRLTPYLPKLRSVLVLAVGIFTLLSRLQMPAFAASSPSVLRTGTAGAPLPTKADCPCHSRTKGAP